MGRKALKNTYVDNKQVNYLVVASIFFPLHLDRIMIHQIEKYTIGEKHAHTIRNIRVTLNIKKS